MNCFPLTGRNIGGTPLRSARAWWRAGCAVLPGLLLALSLRAAQAACLGDATVQPALVFHVVPQFTPATVYAQWTPLLERVGKAAGLCVELRVAPTITDFEQALFRGEPDFAYLNPYHLVMTRRKQAYAPLVADVQNRLSGIVVVRADSGITLLKQLDGAPMAFPAPNAFAATLLLRSILTQQKIVPKPHFVTSHSNVYRALINHDVQAGGAANNTLAREPAEIRNKLRVIYTTPGFVAHPIAAHPRVALAVRMAVVDSLIALETQRDARPLLAAVQIPKPARVTYERDYAPLEALDLSKFVQTYGE